LAERPALGAVPLGVVPFVVADGIVKIVRRNETGNPSSVRDGNCSGVWPMQLGRISGGSWREKKAAYIKRDGIAGTKGPGGFEERMSRDERRETRREANNRGGEESRRWEEGGQSAVRSSI
jgi:hypothetical protein